MAKTTAGHRVLKDRSILLTPRQRAALILLDGQRSVEEVLAAQAGVTQGDIDRLLALGLVAEEPGHSYPMPLLDQASAVSAARDRYLQAYAIAMELAAGLGPRDEQLNLAIEAAGSIAELRALAPRLRAAVGPVRFAPLEAVLGGA